MSRLMLLTLIVLIVPGLLFVGAIVLQQNAERFVLISGAFSYAVLLVQAAYRHSERVYLLVERARILFSGAGATWGARAEFDVAESPDIETICRILLADDPSARHLAQHEPRSHVLVVHDMTIRVNKRLTGAAGEQDSPGDVLIVEVVASERPFRRALTLATEVLPALFERVRGGVKADGEKYSSELRFRGGNPYLGLYLRNVQLRHVDRFVVEITVPIPGDPSDAVVTASKDNVTIVTTRLSSLGTLSRRYLTLAAG